MPEPRVRVVLNPAAGQETSILALLNDAFGEGDWDVSLTKADRETEAVDKALADSPSLLLVYGGDGTVARIVDVLLKRRADVPLGILAGGTANALAEQLGCDGPVEDQLKRFAANEFDATPFNVGRVNGRVFLSRASLGVVAGMTSHAEREDKKRLGLLSYAASTFKAGREAEPQRYSVTLDEGETRHFQAIGAIIANGWGTGIGRKLSSELSAERGPQLDVFVVDSLANVADVLTNILMGHGLMDGLTHMVANRVHIATETPVLVHADGEHVGSTPLAAHVDPQMITFAVPHKQEPEQT